MFQVRYTPFDFLKQIKDDYTPRNILRQAVSEGGKAQNGSTHSSAQLASEYQPMLEHRTGAYRGCDE